MLAKKKIKKGFYFRGYGNFSSLFEHEIYYWDGYVLSHLYIIGGKEHWLDCATNWGEDFKKGTVSIGDNEQFTYLGE